MHEVLTYLDQTDAEAARRARSRYACFDHAAEDSQAYGYAASFGLAPSCEDAVVQQLREMTRRAGEISATPGLERDEDFYAQQNAHLVRNAEEYYRTMFQARVSSWNLRDSHMVETLQALDRHLGAGGTPPRMAVWAHNSHLGDAAATEMGDRGEWNVGQLMRERYAGDAVRVFKASCRAACAKSAPDDAYNTAREELTTMGAVVWPPAARQPACTVAAASPPCAPTPGISSGTVDARARTRAISAG